ncbi:PD-(D/E)XK nuclease domain-containing protein [Rickettsia gravesii]|uniref:PD-(D/E)XK nuclease domain-containing protein n=1 Tax=Rickettsia gravesii TaxID=354585 RepID=UPI000465528F|nr:PD-(D/E)XK nuclease domain-containing protein [Rickettsia gravesii]
MSKPELIELLLNTTPYDVKPASLSNQIAKNKPKGFAEHFVLLLDNMPNIHSVIKPEFFLHFFLGSVLTLPYTSLKSKLNVEDILFKIKKNTNILKLVFKIKDGSSYKLKFFQICSNTDYIYDMHSFKSEGAQYTHDELAEIKDKLQLSQDVHYITGGYNIAFDKIKGETKSEVSISYETGHKAIRNIPSSLGSTFHKVNAGVDAEFDGLFSELNDEDVSTVKTNTENIFKQLIKIYHDYKNILGKSEAAYHGFSYGFFVLNYKYKYALDCYVERRSGKGYMDLILLSRIDNNSPIPIIVELKAEQFSADSAIEQIHNHGYIYKLPSVRTSARNAVIVGVNYNQKLLNRDDIHNYSKLLQVMSTKVTKYDSNFVVELLNNVWNEEQSTSDKIIQDIKKSLEYLYFTSIKSKERTNLSRTLLGEVAAWQNPSDGTVHVGKYVITYLKEDSSEVKDRVITLVLLHSDKDKPSIILNIIENTGWEHIQSTQSRDRSEENLRIDKWDKIPLFNELEEVSEIIKIDVIVTTQANKHFEVPDDSKKGYCNDVLVERKKLSSIPIDQIITITGINKIEIKDVDINKVIKILTDKDYLPPEIYTGSETPLNENQLLNKKSKLLNNWLTESLLPIKPFITSEKDFQSVVQGLFMGQIFNQCKVNTFAEATSGTGRVDIVLKFINKNNEEHGTPIIIELKYQQFSNALLEHVQVQLEQYRDTLKAMTDQEKVILVSMIFNLQGSNNELIYTGFMESNVPHTSVARDHDLDAKMDLDNTARTLEEATERGDYKYWLQAHDLTDIARIKYGYTATSTDTELVIIPKDALSAQLQQFTRERELHAIQDNAKSLILIINLNNSHWVTLVVRWKDDKYQGYYVDSLGNTIDSDINTQLTRKQVHVHDLSIKQQTDGYNCGLWALENTVTLVEMIRKNKDIKWAEEQLQNNNRNEEYFKYLRDTLTQTLNRDPQRQDNMHSILLQEDINLIESPLKRIHSEVVEGIANKCLKLSSDRKKRETEVCKIGWEDVDKFNLAQGDKRDIDKIKIDSDKFLKSIKITKDNEKREQLIQLADEIGSSFYVADGQRITGHSTNLVQNIIRNQKIINPLNKAAKISNKISSVEIGKNIIADLLNGDLEDVAVNVGFLIGGEASAKLGLKALTTGVKLVSEGKVVLGRLLKASAPFLSSGTSAFIVYDLVSQIKEYQAGNKDALIGIIGDSAFLAIDVTEISLEVGAVFLLELEGALAVMGPIGELLGGIIFIGTDIYFAVKKVDIIDHTIHLTGWEKFKEGWRAFLHMNPEDYIQDLMEQKQINNQLVKQAVDFLKQNTNIQKYVFPTAKSVIDFCHNVIEIKTTTICSRSPMPICVPKEHRVPRQECTRKIQIDLNSTVLLDKKVTRIKWSRSSPDSVDNTELFCLPIGDYQEVPSDGAYVCDNAIGVEYKNNRTGNYTLISTGAGEDKVKGFINSPNIFVIGDGKKSLIGGDHDDIFILSGDIMNSTINGGPGNNQINLENFALNTDVIKVTLGQYLQYQSSKIDLYSVNQIIGRKNKVDIIKCNNDTRYVNSQGGADDAEQVDIILIPSLDYSNASMTIEIEANTKIINGAQNGTFLYNNRAKNGKITIDIFDAEQSQHNILFSAKKLSDIQEIQVYTINTTGIPFARQLEQYITIIFTPKQDNSSLNVTVIQNFNASSIFYLSDKAIFKLDSYNKLYGYQSTNKSVDNIIENYPDITKRLNMHLVVYSSPTNDTVYIGNKDHAILYNDANAHSSHLLGVGGENIYVIKYNSVDDMKQGDVYRSLPPVNIYGLNSNQTNTLDLRKLSKQVEQEYNAELTLTPIKRGQDIIISVNATNLYPISIILKDVVINDHYRGNLVIIKNTIPMAIVMDSNKQLALDPKPLYFHSKHQVIVITPKDVAYGNTIIFTEQLKKHYFCYQNDTVIVNTISSNNNSDIIHNIILHRFYQEPIMQSLHIKFVTNRTVNHEISLGKINTNIISCGQLQNTLYNDVLDQVLSGQYYNPQDHHHIRHRNSKILSYINKLLMELDHKVINAVKYLAKCDVITGTGDRYLVSKQIIYNDQSQATKALMYLIVIDYYKKLTRLVAREHHSDHELIKIAIATSQSFKVDPGFVQSLITKIQVGTSVFVDYINREQYELQKVLQNGILNNNIYLNRTHRAVDSFEEIQVMKQHAEIETQDQYVASNASSLSSPINNIVYWLKEIGYELLSTIVKPLYYSQGACSPNNQAQQAKGPTKYDDEIYYDAQENLVEAAVKQVPVVIEELMDDEYHNTLESLPQVIKPIVSNTKEKIKIGKTISVNHSTTELQVTSDIVGKSMLVNDKTGNYSGCIRTYDSDNNSPKLLLIHEKISNTQVIQDLEWCESLMLADVITRSITGEKYKQTIPLSPMQERAIEIHQIEQKVHEGLQKMIALFGDYDSEDQDVQDIEQPFCFEDLDDGHGVYLYREQYLKDIRYLFDTEDLLMC